MKRMRTIAASVVVAGLVLAPGSRAHAGCLIDAVGTQLFVTCEDPPPAAHWRAGVDDGEASHWRASGASARGRKRDQVRRFEEVGSLMVEVEPTLDLNMLKTR